MAVETPICDFGWKAPNFTLPGVDGKTYSLADLRGERGTLIMKETGPADLRRDLFLAMKQVAETGQGPREQIPSAGCSIKWRES